LAFRFQVPKHLITFCRALGNVKGFA
jgi:hypothetical protein